MRKKWFKQVCNMRAELQKTGSMCMIIKIVETGSRETTKRQVQYSKREKQRHLKQKYKENMMSICKYQ